MRPPFKKHKGVNKLRNVHEKFDGWGTSAMREKMQSEVRLGRPFGGTGFIWNKKYSIAIRPRLEYKHERVTVLELNATDGKILLINAYMPYFNASQIENQIAIYADTIGFIESVMDMNLDCGFVLMSDLNCNIYDSHHPFTVLIRDLMRKRDLMCTFDLIDNFDSGSFWTRKGKGQNGNEFHSLIDFVLVSRSIVSKVENVRITEYPENLSDHCPVELELVINLETFDCSSSKFSNSINWKNVKDDIKMNYETVMERELDAILVPQVVHGSCICRDNCHFHLLEDYYDKLKNAIAIADMVLPRNGCYQKNYWNEDLSRLKQESIDAFNLWKDVGRPSSGVIFDMKKAAHYRYKSFLRKSQAKDEREKNERLHEDLVGKDTISFWKSWKSIHGSNRNDAIRIDGFIKDNDVADCFAKSFQAVYQSNDPTRVSSIRSKFYDKYSEYYESHLHDNISFYYLTRSDMLDIVAKMKTGKATAGFIKYEHILYGSPKLMIHLQILFNGLIQHGYVPCDFLSGVITPVVKDAEGDISSTSNYRAITLSVVFASMFESAILMKIGYLLKTDHLQFGYKTKHSCSHAVYVMRTCIDYFTENGSNVFAAFLDCSKGFDKVDHNGIFLKLIDRNVPLCFLEVIIYWYQNLSSVVKWNNAFSASFLVTSGVRQGGILSPRLFIMYVDDLLILLRKSKAGCHIAELFVAAIMYADDLALLAPTRNSLQTLLDVCQKYGMEWCITYNPSKTNLMTFGRQVDYQPVYLNGISISPVSECKYLGVNVVAGKGFSTSSRKPLSSFYCSANTILNILRKPSEQVQMQLLYTNCVPILTYACEVKSFTGRDMTRYDVALNDCIRKVFSFHRWESTRELRRSFGYDSITEIFAKRQRNFLQCLRLTCNPVLVKIRSLTLTQTNDIT